MPYRTIPFVNGEFYHLYNRGLLKQDIFYQKRDYSQFIKTFFYYQIQNPKPKFSIYRQSKTFPVDSSKKIIEIVCYCLMPNHFHLLVKQLTDGGITEFMRRFIHSYTKYRNTKYKLQGPIFQGIFKAVLIKSDEQLLHVSRYIHLNPLVSYLVKDLKDYHWSSYLDYINSSSTQNQPLAKNDILSFFKNPSEYEKFVLDQKDYGITLEILKHTAIDFE